MGVFVFNYIFEINFTVAIVWNTREIGDIYYIKKEDNIKNFQTKYWNSLAIFQFIQEKKKSFGEIDSFQIEVKKYKRGSFAIIELDGPLISTLTLPDNYITLVKISKQCNILMTAVWDKTNIC